MTDQHVVAEDGTCEGCASNGPTERHPGPYVLHDQQTGQVVDLTTRQAAELIDETVVLFEGPSEVAEYEWELDGGEFGLYILTAGDFPGLEGTRP